MSIDYFEYMYNLARWVDEKIVEVGLHDKTVWEQLVEEQKNEVKANDNN